MAHALIKALTPGDISHADLVRGGAIVRRCSNTYESGNGDPMPPLCASASRRASQTLWGYWCLSFF